jgi:hypothetical protein
MTPSHAVKQGTRYRYYVSPRLITKDQTERSAGLRIELSSNFGDGLKDQAAAWA